MDDVVDGYGSVEEWWPEWNSDVVVLCSEVGKNIFSIRCLQFFKWAWKIKKKFIENIENIENQGEKISLKSRGCIMIELSRKRGGY